MNRCGRFCTLGQKRDNNNNTAAAAAMATTKTTIRSVSAIAVIEAEVMAITTTEGGEKRKSGEII